MADVDVKQQSSSGNKQDQQSMTKQNPGGSQISRSRDWEPLSFSAGDILSSNPFTLMRRMSDEMDRTFGRMIGQAAGGGGLSSWYPAIEIAERDGKLQVHAELPGLKPEDVKVELTDGALVIQGERKYENKENTSGVYRSERRYGQFYRAIPLPDGVDAEQAKAQFNNGVLEVSVPLPEQNSKRRQIPIESGGATGSQASGKGSQTK